MGEGHCFQRIEIELIFDQNRKLLDRKASGGEFVEAGALSEKPPK